MKDPSCSFHEGLTPSVPPISIKRVVLTGFMGAGKSTVGHLLARETGWEFLDLDTHIERTHGASAREIFAALGETGFRQLECETFAAALGQANIVLAPGGAVIDRVESQRALANSREGLVVFLDAPFHLLIARCVEQERAGSATYRPLLHRTEVARARYEMRSVLYGRLAHLTVNVAERTPEEVGRIILETMHAPSAQ